MALSNRNCTTRIGPVRRSVFGARCSDITGFPYGPTQIGMPAWT